MSDAAETRFAPNRAGRSVARQVDGERIAPAATGRREPLRPGHLAGKRFLESAPLQLDATPRPTSAPVNRILWSVQVGLVIAAVGVGFLIVKNNVQQDVVQPLFALGILAISLGVGFVVSSFVSYLLSRRLGLWDEQPSRPASEQDV